MELAFFKTENQEAWKYITVELSENDLMDESEHDSFLKVLKNPELAEPFLEEYGFSSISSDGESLTFKLIPMDEEDFLDATDPEYGYGDSPWESYDEYLREF